MIAASRRRRAQGGDVFRLHEALAARTSLSLRLRRGSLLALAASLLALVLGADVTTHLSAVALGLGVGAALPVRGARDEALAYIRGRAGLSYETALDVMTVGGEDEFGLRSSVVERARLAVRDVRPEPAPAWWLPALAVALGLVLFSLAGPVGRPGAGGAGGGNAAQPGAQPPAAPEAAPAVEQESEVPAPPDDAPGRAADAGAADRRDEDTAPEGPAAAPPGGDGSAASPMSRFLDSLRERPESTPPPERPGQPGQPGAEPPRADGPASPAERQGEPERAQLDRQESSQQQPGDQPQPQGQEGQGQPEGQGEDDGGGDQAEGQQPQQPQEEGQGEQGGEGEQDGQPGPSDQPGGEGGEMPDAGGDPGADQGGDTTRGLMPDDGSEPPDPDDEVGAGGGAGPESEAGVAAGDPGGLEVLPGVLQDGPENPAGTVRLPGDTEVFLPPGRAVTEYQTAAEEALSEGDLPLAYQEVIRRYFR